MAAIHVIFDKTGLVHVSPPPGVKRPDGIYTASLNIGENEFEDKAEVEKKVQEVAALLAASLPE